MEKIEENDVRKKAGSSKIQKYTIGFVSATGESHGEWEKTSFVENLNRHRRKKISGHGSRLGRPQLFATFLRGWSDYLWH